MQTFYLARQPIYDSGLKVAGYELLFRGGRVDSAEFENGDQATSEVITSSVVDIGLNNLVGTHPAFINATRGFLSGELPLPDLKGQIVLEVLEDIEVTEALVKRLGALSRAGYRLALDDFVLQPGSEPLLDVADFVKLDVCALDHGQLVEHVARIRPHRARLIAEKVETYEVMALCQQLGFDMYQGFFFCRPRLISGKRPEANRLAVLQLITRLQDPNAGIDELERLVTCDPALSYRLLKYINSAYCGVPVEVTSIRQALILVGTNLVRGWATLLLLSRLSDGKPSELIVTALVRARMCELLGAADPEREPNQYFTVGLLSVLDALLDLPMEEVVEGLPFDGEVCAALSALSGPIGTTLSKVIDYEQGAGGVVDVESGLAEIYLQALAWATETQQAIS